MTEPGTETTAETATAPGTDPSSHAGGAQDALPQPAAEVTKEQQPMTGAGEPADHADHDGNSKDAAVAGDPGREPTGDAAVDEALEEFDRVTGAPLDTHIEVAERVHQKLQDRLTDLGNA